MFPKTKRIVDKALLEEIKKKPCVVCGKGPCDPHHIKTRGSGGGDVADNLLALCREHHTEIHTIGVYTFLLKYGLE